MKAEKYVLYKSQRELSIYPFNLVKRINKTAKNLWGGGDLTGQGGRWEGERKKKKETKSKYRYMYC